MGYRNLNSKSDWHSTFAHQKCTDRLIGRFCLSREADTDLLRFPWLPDSLISCLFHVASLLLNVSTHKHTFYCSHWIPVLYTHQPSIHSIFPHFGTNNTLHWWHLKAQRCSSCIYSIYQSNGFETAHKRLSYCSLPTLEKTLPLFPTYAGVVQQQDPGNSSSLSQLNEEDTSR